MQKTINVFLDTHVFVEQHYDIQNRMLRQLLALKEAGAIRLFSTSVTLQEIEADLAKNAGEAYRILKSLKKNSALRILEQPLLNDIKSRLTKEQFTERLRNSFMEFWQKLGVEVIPHNSKTLGQVLERYFKVAPPFGSGEKKAEFPDAIAADSLVHHCSENQIHMLVVSGDGDWEKVCKETKCLTHKDKLEALLADFPKVELAMAAKRTIELRWDVFREHIQDVFGEFLLSLSQTHLKVESVGFSSIDRHNIYVIHAEGHYAVAEIQCEAHFEANLVWDNAAVRSHPGTFSSSPLFRETVEIFHGHVTKTMEVSFEFDPELRIDDVKILDPVFHIPELRDRQRR